MKPGAIHTWLWGNQLTGPIPTEFGSLTNLTELLLFSNQLTGAIPAELGNLTSLRLGGNQLSGPVPPELTNLTNLNFLRLRGQVGCLTAADPIFAAWLAGFDPFWNNGC